MYALAANEDSFNKIKVLKSMDAYKMRTSNTFSSNLAKCRWHANRIFSQATTKVEKYEFIDLCVKLSTVFDKKEI
jgi:hypothetical protein